MEERNYTVYLHINPKNEKVYVGITNQNVHKRWKNGHGYVKCKKFYDAILKYGWDNFKHIIFCSTNKDKALLLEKVLIKYYKNRNLSYNITEGGEDSIPTNEAKEKISKAGNRPCSVEKKMKISIANSGASNGMFGKTMPINTKVAIIAAISRPVLQLDLDNNIINSFSSASEAERHLNGKGSHVSCCCLGKRKTAYGHKWKYE